MGNRETILSAARDVFLRDGFSASMDAVAAEAEVARRTVFNHFETKEALFEATIAAIMHAHVPRLLIDTNGDLRTNLLDFARRYLTAMTSPDVVMLYRMAHGSPRSAEHLRALTRVSYDRIRGALAGYFAQLVAMGEMRTLTPNFAAERFLASVVGLDRVEISLGFTPDPAGRDGYLCEAVDGFLSGVLERPD